MPTRQVARVEPPRSGARAGRSGVGVGHDLAPAIPAPYNQPNPGRRGVAERHRRPVSRAGLARPLPETRSTGRSARKASA